MKKNKPTYEELRERLERAEAILEALRSGEVDILVGENEPLVVSFKSIVQERERLRVEAERLAREWQKTFDAANDAIWILDRDSRILRSNKTAERFFNRPCSEMIGKHCWEIVHGTTKPIPECPILRVRNSLRRETMDFLIGERWFEVNVDPLLNEAGQYVGAVHIISDITERKKMEEAVRESEEHFRAIVENANDGILIAGADGSHLYANRRASEITGYSIDELLKIGMGGLAHPDEIPILSERLRRRIAGEEVPQQYETRFVHKNGRTVPIEISGARTVWKGQVATLVIIRDITERKQAMEKLHESEEKYRTLVERANDGIVIIQDGVMKFANQRIAEMWGGTPEEIVGTRFTKYVHPDELSKVEDYYRRRMSGEKVTSIYETILQRRNGSALYAEINAGVISYEGRPADLVIIRDITERKRVEEALRQSEERYRALVEGSFDGIFIQKDSKIIYANKRLYEMLGYEQGELVGKDHWVIYHPDYQDFTRERAKARIRGEDIPPQYEVKLQRRDGSFFEGEVLARKIWFGDEPGIQVWVRDMSQRKEAEEKIMASEERYRSLIESSSDAILGLDKERNIVSCNQGFCDLFGFSREEAEGRSIRIVHDSDESFHSFGEISYPMVKRQGYFRGEWDFVRKDGTKIPSEVVISAIKSPQGVITGYVSIVRDLTARKRMEQEMASLQAQLQQAQKMEAIGRLAGGIAHDFNNLLSVIKGTCQLSVLDLREGDPLYANLKEIERATDRAADLTRQLLAFSRKQMMEMRVLDLNEVIKGLEKMLHRLIGEDIELVTYLAEGLGWVKVDPGQMEQAIINIVVNARDAMPQGGKLTVETVNVELDEEYARRHIAVKPGSYVMMAISDTGVGMTKEVKERLFEPFFTTKEMGKGTGLGLSTVYGIVKQSGGNIWVYSEPGQGATFKIYLPRVDEPMDELKEEIIKEIPHGSETLLIVEDEEGVRKLAVRILKRQGYQVLEAEDGGKAFMLCEKYKEPVHLILTDVVMPGMSGRQLAERLKEIHPEAKVLYMSGYTDNAIAHHGILEEGIEFIQKPFTLESLARKVRRVLDKA